VKTILFIVDVKPRDLASIALISYYLKKKYKIIYGRSNELLNYIDKKFDCVILPKMNRFDDIFKYFIFETVRKEKKIICIENEGNINVKIKKNFLLFPNLFFFWGKKQFKNYKDFFPIKNNIKIMGNPRLDFFHKKFNSLLIDKKNYLKKNRLKNNFCLTFTTRTQEAHKSLSIISNISKRRSYMYSEPKKYFKDYASSARKMLSLTENIIFEISKKYPKINILIKPHPGESLKYWNNLERKIPNLRIVKDMTLENFLKLSDLNVSQNICSSTFEAKLMKIKTIELQTSFVKKYSSKIHQQLADYVVFDKNKFFTIFHKFIKKKEKKKYESKKIKKYINNFFYKFDGLRCRYYAKEIDRFFKNRQQNKIKFQLNKNQLQELQRIKIRFEKEKINKKIIDLKKILSNLLPTSKDKLKYDNKFRHDHRYNTNDEKKWYKKFDKLKLKYI